MIEETGVTATEYFTTAFRGVLVIQVFARVTHVPCLEHSPGAVKTYQNMNAWLGAFV